jgi:hypothetical protein
MQAIIEFLIPKFTLYGFNILCVCATRLVTQSDTIRKGNAMMIVVRDTFQAKFGKAGALVALFKELRQQWPGQSVDRIFTDASGPFDTVVTEATVESVAAWQQRQASVSSMPAFGDWFARMMPLVESGRREFYTIEE